MKKILVFLMFFVLSTPLTFQAKNTSKSKEIRVHSNIKEHSSVLSLLGKYKSAHKKRVVYLYPSYEVAPDYLRTHMRASWLLQNGFNLSQDIVWGNAQPIRNDHLLTPEDYEKYKAHDIVVLKKDCRSDWNNKVLYSALADQNSKAVKKIGGKKYSPFMLLSSDNTKKSMIYNCEPIKWFTISQDLAEASWLTTLHRGRIAILIDELGNIVHILDDVKLEDDIFKAFGIK